MLDTIKKILASEGIERVGIVDIKECDIINPRILPDGVNSAIIFCIPYRSTLETPKDGFSEYARIYDYHKFGNGLYSRILNKLEHDTDERFFGFCDHSPINEKLAAAKCGLGVIGRNSLFIDDIYGSFVFLGSVLSTAKCETTASEIRPCENCGRCISACPQSAITDNGIDRARCLSAISQKKTRTEEEEKWLSHNKTVWGCDICQLVCPHNQNAKISPIPYFKDTRIPHIDKAYICSLSDEEFDKYAFSYKGRKIVLKNLEIM